MTTSARVSRAAVLPVLLAAVAVSVLSACSSIPEGPKPTLAGSNTYLAINPSFYGGVLTDGTGRVVYQFTRDQPGGPVSCEGTCETMWQPYIAAGEPTPQDSRINAIDEQKLGTITRPDGQQQVSYGGHPLYFYAGDKKPGDILGAGKTEFGGQWYGVTPAAGPVYP